MYLCSPLLIIVVKTDVNDITRVVPDSGMTELGDDRILRWLKSTKSTEIQFVWCAVFEQEYLKYLWMLSFSQDEVFQHFFLRRYKFDTLFI